MCSRSMDLLLIMTRCGVPILIERVNVLASVSVGSGANIIIRGTKTAVWFGIRRRTRGWYRKWQNGTILVPRKPGATSFPGDGLQAVLSVKLAFAFSLRFRATAAGRFLQSSQSELWSSRACFARGCYEANCTLMAADWQGFKEESIDNRCC